jgi:1,4-dihydroxy-6-naphthoate synthase
MFYGFQSGAVTIPGFEVKHVLKDIQELNVLAREGELEVTAVSAAAYPTVADKYWVMNVGSSVGRGYGPVVVARQPADLSALEGKRLAVPGLQTTAHLLARLLLPAFEPVVVRFDEVMDVVNQGGADFALVIHDGQLTYAESGFHKVADLGVLWKAETDLPIPLGLDLVRKDLGRPLAETICAAMKASIEHALAHPRGADEYARTFGRNLDLGTSARFVRMYVNEDTLDFGSEGRRALEALFERAGRLGLADGGFNLDIVGA